MSRMLLATIVVSLQLPITPATVLHEQLLRASDIGAHAPPSFVARLVLKSSWESKPRAIEVWSAGGSRLLVRFLEEGAQGRYLLRRDRDVWLLAPGAKKPVKLSPAHRVYGGLTLDETLGIQLVRDYRIEYVVESMQGSERMTDFMLRAESTASRFPTVRYVVRNGDSRPVTAEYRLLSGKTATVVEFVEWPPGPLRYARRVIVKDQLRKGVVTEVEITSFEERPVPDGLFDLENSAARRQLEGGRPPGANRGRL